MLHDLSMLREIVLHPFNLSEKPVTYVRVTTKDNDRAIFRGSDGLVLDSRQCLWYRGSGIIDTALNGESICRTLVSDESRHRRSDTWPDTFKQNSIYAKQILIPKMAIRGGTMKFLKPMGNNISEIQISYKDHVWSIFEKELYNVLMTKVDVGIIPWTGWQDIQIAVETYVKMLGTNVSLR